MTSSEDCPCCPGSQLTQQTVLALHLLFVAVLFDPLHDVLALRLVAELDEVKPLAHILRQILQVSEHLLRDERLELVKLLRHHVSAG